MMKQEANMNCSNPRKYILKTEPDYPEYAKKVDAVIARAEARFAQFVEEEKKRDIAAYQDNPPWTEVKYAAHKMDWDFIGRLVKKYNVRDVDINSERDLIVYQDAIYCIQWKMRPVFLPDNRTSFQRDYQYYFTDEQMIEQENEIFDYYRLEYEQEFTDEFHDYFNETHSPAECDDLPFLTAEDY